MILLKSLFWIDARPLDPLLYHSQMATFQFVLFFCFVLEAIVVSIRAVVREETVETAETETRAEDTLR